jgi:hypothetical protein
MLYHLLSSVCKKNHDIRILTENRPDHSVLILAAKVRPKKRDRAGSIPAA